MFFVSVCNLPRMPNRAGANWGHVLLVVKKGSMYPNVNCVVDASNFSVAYL